MEAWCRVNGCATTKSTAARVQADDSWQLINQSSKQATKSSKRLGAWGGGRRGQEAVAAEEDRAEQGAAERPSAWRVGTLVCTVDGECRPDALGVVWEEITLARRVYRYLARGADRWVFVCSSCMVEAKQDTADSAAIRAW